MPFLIAAIALWIALSEDRIRSFFPTLWREWFQMLSTWFAQNTFWPEAGWCWHYEHDKAETAPGGPWMTWRHRFVWRDPVKAGDPWWTWSLVDAAYTVRISASNSPEGDRRLA